MVLSKQNLAIALFRLVGTYLEPGSMLFVSYITDIAYDMRSSIHEVTRRCVERSGVRIPPACTPLGMLLVAAGCWNVKSDGYNVQGSHRLAGEKAPDDTYQAAFVARLWRCLQDYVDAGINDELFVYDDVCRRNARRLLFLLDQQSDEKGSEA